MKDFLTFIGGIVTLIIVASYCLAAFFAPFGIVWLVLAH
tara:strand:+ start:485 stop:601 length:117 start_codon:yes stop_codon:yes gene_type:complete